MSIRLMSEVWDLVELSQSETLVALAIADHADEDGRCFPSVDRIARKARLGRRRTQQIIRRLEAAGHLTVIETGRGRGHTSRYELHFGKGARIAPFTDSDAERVKSPTPKRCNPGAVKGETAIAPESSDNHQGEPSAGSASALPPARDLAGDPIDTTAQRKANGNGRAYRLPEDFALTPERRAYADSERVDAERTFAKFRDHWLAASGARARKRDWDAAWRNWCREEADRQSRRPSTSRPGRRTFDEIFGPKETDQ